MFSAAKSGPWWRRQNHADRRPLLLGRNRIVAALRRWFEAESFVEVQSAALQISPGNETHLHAFATEMVSPANERKKLYLHTSPEFAMKKLLAAGEERIFDFARVFRNRESGALHSPEFTLLEWYRANEPYERLMQDCAAILAAAAEAAETRLFTWRGRTTDTFAPPDRITVCEAFDRFAGIDLLDSLAANDAAENDRDTLAARAGAIGVRVAADDTWPDIFSRILVDRIEPHLGMGRATILYEYPASEAALARRKAADPRFAERFELYACGVELANAFGELTDPVEQRRRFAADMDEKERIHGERYPIDEGFLAALAAMPRASGCALGLDRLVILVTGATHINQVLWTPPPGTSGQSQMPERVAPPSVIPVWPPGQDRDP